MEHYSVTQLCPTMHYLSPNHSQVVYLACYTVTGDKSRLQPLFFKAPIADVQKKDKGFKG